jgi:hypothetical protein
MKLAEIPKEIQTKNGIITNPGLINDVAKTKGVLMSGRIPGVQSVYFEMYEDIEEKAMDCGFEIAQFKSDAEMWKILPKGDKMEKGVILLTVQNYLIILTCDRYRNYGERLDTMSVFFRKKLGAKLYLDRERDAETAVVDDDRSNFPSQLPPKPKSTSIALDLGDLKGGISKINGMAYMLNKRSEKLMPGAYRATSSPAADEIIEFTIDKDGLLDGDYTYYNAKENSKSQTKESRLTYDHGVLTSEAMYSSGSPLGTKNYSATVVKQEGDYLITIKTSIKIPGKGNKEIVTVFRNRKPISKMTTRPGVSVIRKDFEKDYLDEFDSKGKLVRLQKTGLIEKYNSTGEVIYKEEWFNGGHYIYKNGKLIKKEIPTKDNEQFLVTEYDGDGKVTAESKGIEKFPEVPAPEEYENDLTEALLAYYKGKVQD